MELSELPLGGSAEAAVMQPVTSMPELPIHPTTAILKNAHPTSVLKAVTVLRPIGAVDANSLISVIDQTAQVSKSGLTAIQIRKIFKWFPYVSYTLPLGSSFKTAQQQNFALSIRFNLLGDGTPIAFTY
ncbi:MAG: hypothetical protein ACRD9L_05815, partial [Bryobacteraceae bacterium]